MLDRKTIQSLTQLTSITQSNLSAEHSSTEPRQSGSSKSSPRILNKQLRVLVIGRDLPPNHVLASDLKRHGHEVQFANSGIASLVIAEQLKPQLVVVELSRDGAEAAFVKRLRERSWSEGSVVIGHSIGGSRFVDVCEGLDYRFSIPIDPVLLIHVYTSLTVEKSEEPESELGKAVAQTKVLEQLAESLETKGQTTSWLESIKRMVGCAK